MVASADRATLCRSRTRGGWAPGVVRGPNHRRVVDAKTLTAWGVGSGTRRCTPSAQFVPSSTTPHSPRFSVYVELHCHSAFSFLDGASLPEQLALTAANLGYPALALTDHNGIYGAMAFAQEAKSLGLQAITGAELTLLDGSHVTILAETPEGYANLCRLITEAHLRRADRRDPRLEFAALEARHEGLIVLSGCRDGFLPQLLRKEGRAAARACAERCRAVFGHENFFVELQRNYVRGDLALTRALRDLAHDVQLGVVASGNVHYHARERHRPQGEFTVRSPRAAAPSISRETWATASPTSGAPIGPPPPGRSPNCAGRGSRRATLVAPSTAPRPSAGSSKS